ncbi:hypothetical protein EVAR_22695_1 [Eumeta japonica]|uniref:Uncharacterized protein n=1 Tax=Eumeta variegata TaxID=151549 RepID=A0A4C1UU32_EUMVA|nr:hypothetical protein EVAR_22695_1 [Eumeta japonica]
MNLADDLRGGVFFHGDDQRQVHCCVAHDESDKRVTYQQIRTSLGMGQQLRYLARLNRYHAVAYEDRRQGVFDYHHLRCLGLQIERFGYVALHAGPVLDESC